jgi:hypothetical protein
MEICTNQPSAGTPTHVADNASSPSFADIRRARLVTLCALGASATAISVCIAAYAGGLRGDTGLAQLVWIALGVVAVFGLHLLPMYFSQAGTWLRTLLFVIWIALLAFVMDGQATFFLIEQINAGDKRAKAVPVIIDAIAQMPSGRSPTVIADDAAEVSAKLALVDAIRCTAGACPTVRVRKATLSARLAALVVEADEVKRREAEEDRRQAQADKVQAIRDSRRSNPVASSLASLLDTTEARLNSILVFIPTVVLDGLAVACWLLVAEEKRRARQRGCVAFDDCTVVAQPQVRVKAKEAAAAVTTEPVVATCEPVAVAAVDSMSGKSEDDTVLDEIHKGVVTGRVKATQTEIRKFLRCGQQKAGRLNRIYAERFGSTSA